MDIIILVFPKGSDRMSFAIISAIGIGICWKWGNWRNWREYYPTILFVFLANLAYVLLTDDKPLWTFGMLSYRYPFVNLIIMVLLYPGTVILYLTFYPKAWQKQIVYILLWVVIYLAVEVAAYFTRGFEYFNGWTVYYSFIFNLIMFPLIRLHYKKPLLAWPISAILAIIVIWWFRIPLSEFS